MKKIFKAIARWFVKITGFIPYLFYLKPKYVYASEKAKKEFKNLKNGAILVSNHTRIFDYYVILYKLFFKVVHTFVADVVYKIHGLSLLNSAFENIKIFRNGVPNHEAINEAAFLLRKQKVILIFPEGKLEDKKGQLEKFSNTASYLSMKENKKIFPFYIDGNYGFFKRPICFIGEAIYPDPTLEDQDVGQLTDKIKDDILSLKNKTGDCRKYKTKTIFTFKYWIMDFIKITSIPFFYLIFLTKKYYTCKRKEIKKALNYNCIVAGNHLGPCDPFFIYMHFFSRRIKIIATEQVFELKKLVYGLKKSGVIKYHRDSMNHIDIDAFKESLDTLNGNGCIGIFPEGHINFDMSLDGNIKEGAATLSLLTNSPIIPFVFMNQYRYFRFNKVVMGKPIYPSDYFDKSEPINAEKIDKYNKIIYNEFKSLYDLSLGKRNKNGYRGDIK